MDCKGVGKIEQSFDENEKIFSYVALVVALKKRLFIVFPAYLYFPDFLQVWRIEP